MNARSNDASINESTDSAPVWAPMENSLLSGTAEVPALQDLLTQLLPALQASAEPADRALVAALSADGFAGLAGPQTAEFVQRLAELAEQSVARDARQVAQADAGELVFGRTTEDAPSAVAVLLAQAEINPATGPVGGRTTTESDNARPPADPPQPTGRLAVELLRALVEGRVPSVTESTGTLAIAAPSPSLPTDVVEAGRRFAAELLRGLNEGAFPNVSGATSTVLGQGLNAPVPGFPAATTPPLTTPAGQAADTQAFVQASLVVQQAASLLPGGRGSVSASLNNTSGVQMGQVQGLTSLGSGTEVANAALITPFVLQVVNPDGSLTTQPLPLGQTTDPIYTGGFNPALSLGGAGAQLETTQAVLPSEQPQPQAPLVPDPSGRVSVSCLTPRVIEGTGENGITEIVFLLTRTNPLSVESIAWAVSGLEGYDLVDGTAGFSGLAQFAGGQLTQEVRLRVRRDQTGEPDRPLVMTINDGLYSTVETGTATSQLIDDDLPTLSVNDVVVDEKAGYAVFTVSISNPTVQELLFTPSLGGVTARPGVDTGSSSELEYSSDGGLTWLSASAGARLPALSTSILVRTAIVDEGVYEGSESFQLVTGPVLEAATRTPAILENSGGASGTGTLKDDGTNGTVSNEPDDDRPTMQVTGVTNVSEGSPAVFTLRLSNPLERPTSIDLQLTNTTTEAGDVDPAVEVFYFTDPVNRTGRTVLPVVNGRIELPGGVTELFVEANTRTDNVHEGPESFGLSASFGDPALKYADRTGINPAVRTGASSNGTSNVLDDGSGTVYDRDGNPVTDNPNTTGIDESAPDDDRPVLSVAGVNVEEGSSAVFTVSLSNALENPANVALSLDDVGLSAESTDYGSFIVYTNPADVAGSTLTVTGGVFSLPGSTTTFYVKAVTNNDTVYEGAEDFRLTASFDDAALKFADRLSGTTRTGHTANATSTIFDDGSQSDGDDDTDGDTTDGTDNAATRDDERPVLSVTGVNVEEGSSAVFTVSLSNALENPANVALSLDDVGLSAESTDYGSFIVYTNPADVAGSTLTVTGGVFSLPGSTTTFYVKAVTNNDTVYEGAEDFRLTASFDDAALKFADRLSGTTRTGHTANATSTIFDDGSQSDGDDDTDGDTTDGTDNAATRDDDRPTLSVAGGLRVSEGSAALFDVVVTGQREGPVSILLEPGHVTTQDGDWSNTVTAFYFTDEVNRTGLTELTVTNESIDLPPGVSIFHVRIQTADDFEFEGRETLQLTATFVDPVLRYEDASLASPVDRAGASDSDTDDILDDGSGTVYDPEGRPVEDNSSTTQVDESASDDDRPVYTLTTPSVTVFEGGSMPFGVRRSSSVGAETLNYEVVVSTGDQTTLPTVRQGTVSFVDGQSEATITLASRQDQRITPDQAFSLVLSTSNPAIRIDQGTGRGVVRNDDAEISIESITPSSGPDADGFYTFNVVVSRTGTLDFAHSVRWSVAGVGENPAPGSALVAPANAEDRVLQFAANDPNLNSDSVTFSFKARVGALQDGVRSFQVQLSEDPATAAQVTLGRDAARGGVPAVGALASVETVTSSLLEGTEGLTPAQDHQFRAKLSQAVSSDVVLNWRVVSFGSASSADADGADFSGGTFPTGQVTIQAGQTSALFSVSPVADGNTEGTERFKVEITVASGLAEVAGPAALGRIFNDDSQFSFVAPTSSANEGNSDLLSVFSADVLRTGFLRGASTIKWHLEPLNGDTEGVAQGYFASGQNALGDSNGLPSGTLTFASGDIRQPILIRLAGNEALQPDGVLRQFRIVLDASGINGSSVASGAGTSVGTITDDDSLFEMGGASLVQVEKQEGEPSVVEVTVVRRGDLRGPAEVNWVIQGSGTNPINGSDLQSGSYAGTLVFDPNQSSATIQVLVDADDLLEANESFTIRLNDTPTVGHRLNTDPAKLRTEVTLTNDDTVVTFDPSQSNLVQTGDEDGDAVARPGKIFTFQVLREGDLTAPLSVPWTIATGAGIDASDFTAASGTVTFAAGSATAQITVTAVADRVVESNETFTLSLAPASGSGIRTGATGTATGTLVNDDVSVTATLVAAVREDANSPNSTYTYTLQRAGDTLRQTTDIGWDVQGLALTNNGVTVANALSAGELSLPSPNTLSWAAADTSTRTISINVNGDTVAEGDEAFKLALSNQSGDRTDLVASGMVGIVSDDDTSLSIVLLSNTPVEERGQGTANAITFRVGRTGDLSSMVVVDLVKAFNAGAAVFSTAGITGPTQLTFQPGSQTVAVRDGNGQTYNVTLRGGTQTQDVTFWVPGNNLVDPQDRTFTVNLANAVTTPAVGLTADSVAISTTNGAATATLTDDDDGVTVSLQTVQYTEGNSGEQDVVFTLTRNGDISKQTTLEWRAMAGSGLGVNADDFSSGQETAQQPNQGMPSGTVTFAANESVKTVTVRVSGDTAVEGDESLRLLLTAPSGNTEIDDAVQATILADDTGYALVARETSLQEGNDPSVARYIHFDFSRYGFSADPITLKWTLTAGTGFTTADIEAIEVDGVPVSAGDLGALFGNFSLAAGQTGAVIRVRLAQEQLNESDETFTLKVEDTAGSPAFTAFTTSDVSVLNDDVGLRVTAAVASVAEGIGDDLTNAGSTEYTAVSFTVQRIDYEGVDTTAQWRVTGAGINAEDFKDGILPTGTLSFNGPTAPDQTVTVYVRKDWLGEQDEPLTLELFNASAGTDLSQGSASTTLLNDDSLITVSNATVAAALSQVEGDGTGTWTNFSFTITRSLKTTGAQRVDWQVLAAHDDAQGAAGASGISPTDFFNLYLEDPSDLTSDPVLPYGFVEFAAGEISKTLTLKVKADTFTKTVGVGAGATSSPTLEGDEPFRIELFNAGVTASKGLSVSETEGTAYAEILNDDIRIEVVALVNSLPEGQDPANNGGDVNIFEPGIQVAGTTGTGLTQRIVLRRTGDLSQAVSFGWYVKDPNFDERMLTTSVDGVTSGSWDASANEQKGVISWAAGDGAEKTLYFTPISDDIGQPDYEFNLMIRPDPAAPAAAALIDEFGVVEVDGATLLVRSVLNQTIGTGAAGSPHLSLATFKVQADEARVWISNSVAKNYNPDTSRYDRFYTPDAVGFTDEETAKLRVGFSEFDETTKPYVKGATAEGSVYVAQAGQDYTALPQTTLSFTENQRVQTLTVPVIRDGSPGENVETWSLFLKNANGAALASDQASQWIVDGNGSLSQPSLRVLGSTAIEGVDTHLNYRIELGSPTTQTNVFAVSLSGTALQDALAGKTGDYYRYFEYSTNGGTSWKSTAPDLDFTFQTGIETQARTERATYRFDNTGAANTFDAWLDFGDVQRNAGYRVGGNFSTLGFAASEVPLDTSGRIYIVVERDGAYIDDNNNGKRDATETTLAFDNTTPLTTPAVNGVATWGKTGSWDFTSQAVTIEFNDVPTTRLDLSNFNANDRIVIDLAAMSANGRNVGTEGLSTTTGSATWDFYGPRWQDVMKAQATANGVPITTSLEAYRWAQSAYYFGDSLVRIKFGDITVGQDSGSTVLGYLGPWNSQSNPINGTGTILSQFNFISPIPIPRADIWIPVRADLAIDPNALSIGFDNIDSVGFVEGRFVGVADLQSQSGINMAALTHFRQLSGNSTASFDDLQAYFNGFDPRGLTGDNVKFLRFQIDWDETGGAPDWWVQGLDAAEVIAPQNGEWQSLQLVQDVQVAAGESVVDTSIQLGATAAFDTDSTSLVAADHVQGLTAVPTVPVAGTPDGAVTISVGAGVDQILVRHVLVNDAIDEALEQATVSVKQLSGDVLTANFGVAKVTLADDDAPVLTTGKTTVGYDIAKDTYYLLKALDVNNRAGEEANLSIGGGGGISFYGSTSQTNNAGNEQPFTAVLRFNGSWEAAIINTSMDQGVLAAYKNGSVAYQHSTPPKFLNLAGTAEVINGVATGYTLAELAVPAGSFQIMLRSAVAPITLPPGVTLVDDQDEVLLLLTAEERAAAASVSAEVAEVAPLIVARSVAVKESDGEAQIEVVAVGGDLSAAPVHVDVESVDGAWTERRFIISREFSTLGDVTIDWALTLPSGPSLPAGQGSTFYVQSYYENASIAAGSTNDFLALGNETIASNGLTGSVTLRDGQKEAVVLLRVLSDVQGEAVEDFKITLVNAPDSVRIIGNPEKEALYDDPLYNMVNTGAGRISNDDRVFSVTGLVFNEAKHTLASTTPEEASAADEKGTGFVALDSNDQLIALKAQWRASLQVEWTAAGRTFTDSELDTFIAGYKLHQFVIKLDGDLVGAASVDWQIRVSGQDALTTGAVVPTDQVWVSGLNDNFDPARLKPGYTYSSTPLGNEETVPNDRNLYVVGPHGMERGDLLPYGGPDPRDSTAAFNTYNQSFGLFWDNSLWEDGVAAGIQPGEYGNYQSVAKRAYFAEGEAYKLITFAVANDSFIEDAEELKIVLSNPQALEGSVSPVQVNPEQDTAYVLVGDDDGPTVGMQVLLDQGGVRTSLTSGLDLLEGTNGTADAGKTVVMRFTRNINDPGAGVAVFPSQVHFQVKYDGVDEIGPITGFEFVNNPSIIKTKVQGAGVEYTFWSGVVNFKREDDLSTPYDDRFIAETAFRIADDDLVQSAFLDNGLPLEIKIYDAETFPTAPEPLFQGLPNLMNDVEGFGEETLFADWSITRVDPATSTFELNIREDDIRLWVGELDRNVTAWTVPVDDTNFEGDGDWTPIADPDQQHTPFKTNGDLVVAMGRDGYESGDISMDWEIRLDGTATQADFNPGSGLFTVVNRFGVEYLVGQAPITWADGQLVFEGLLVNDLNIEDGERFTLILSNPVNSEGKKVLFSPNFEVEGVAPNPALMPASSVRGRTTMEATIVIANDDVVFGVDWHADNTSGRTLEGDVTTPVPLELKFDVSRVLDVTAGQGYLRLAAVSWRLVPINNSAITADDFIGNYGAFGNNGLPAGRVNFPAYRADVSNDPATLLDTLQTITLQIRGDNRLEFGESFRIELYDPTIGHVDPSNRSIDGMIVNDDTGLRVESLSVLEGDAGDTTVDVTVTRLGDLDRHSKAAGDRITDFDWTVLDVDTNSDDRGTGSFSGNVTMGDADTTTNVGGMVDGYGTESTTFRFKVQGDAISEIDERMTALLTGITGVDEVLSSSATVTITNEDAVFTVVPTQGANNQILEGSADTYQFTIQRNVSTPQSQTVTWSVVAAGGRNLADATDFGSALPTGTVTFAPGELSKEITFVNAGDATSETDEVFTVEVTAFGLGAENDVFVASGSGARGTIVNDDLSVFIGDTLPVTQEEGSVVASPSTYRFAVVRSGSPQGSTLTAVVDWALQFSGSGAAASDFINPATGNPYTDDDPITGTVTLAADGQAVVELLLNPDTTAETGQDFEIILSANSGSTGSVSILGSPAAARIGDDDYTLAFVDGSASVVTSFSGVEGDGLSTLTVGVKRDGPDDLPVDVQWTLQFGATSSSAAASDFRATTGQFTIPAGVSLQSFDIPIAGDTQYEVDEGFTVVLNYGTRTVSATGTLTNDDEGFAVATITPVKENAASGTVSFTVDRSGDTDGPSSVKWTLTGSGSNPVSGNDLSGPLTGLLEFADGEASKTVTVGLVGDSVYEPDENFTVTLSDPSAGSSLVPGGVTAIGTILNDDQAYDIVADVSQLTEDTSGNTVVFTVTRKLTDLASSVDWSLSAIPGSAASTSLSPADLLVNGVAATSAAFAANSLAFAVGEASKTVTVRLASDTDYELDSTLRMSLDRHTGDTTSTLLTNAVDVAVRDDDSVLDLAVVDAGRKYETNDGQLQAYTFKVTRTGSVNNATSVRLTLAGDGEHQINGADITRVTVDGVQVLGSSLGPVTLQFAANGPREQTIVVYVKGDNVGEFDEGFKLTLTDPGAGANLGTSSADAVVLNEDPALILSMTTTSVAEGNDGADNALNFVVRRTGDLSGVASVDWAVLAALSGNAVDAADFGGQLPAGALTFQPGEVSKSVTVMTAGDELGESDEGLLIRLSNATGATLIGATDVAATLLNDDASVYIAAPSPATVIEGQAGAQSNVTFTLSASGPTDMTRVVVNWHVEGTGTYPTNGLDFFGGVLPSGQTTINLTSGSGTASIVIGVAGDNIFGPNEGFKVVLDSASSLIGSAVGGASLTVPEATVTVKDDDTLIGLSQAETHRYVEGNSGTTQLRFYVDEINRSADGAQLSNIRVNYSLSGDIDATDVSALSGTNVALTQDTSGGANNGRYYLGVTLNGDATVEGSERFTLRLDQAGATSSTGGGVEIAQSGATVSGTVLNDDFAIQLTSSSLVQNEDTGRFVFDVVRTGPTDDTMTVQWTLGNPSNLLTGDYGVSANDYMSSTTGNVTFAAGSSSARFSLDVAADQLAETNEKFAVKAEVIGVGTSTWTANPDQMDVVYGEIINDDPLPGVFNPADDQIIHPPLAAVV